jgi:hypothetical protein
MQSIVGRTDSSRISRNAAKDFGDQRPLAARNIKLRFSLDDETANDFTECQAIAEIPHLDLIRGSVAEAALNMAQEVTRQVRENASDSWPLHYHLPAAGNVALVNGTPVNYHPKSFASGTTYTSGSTTARIKIDTGPIALFEPGTRWDFYSSAGVLQADEVEIVQMNPAEKSVGIKLITSGPNQSTVANLNSLADNAVIYRSGERNQGMRSSFGNYFSDPVASENFIGGVDRTTTDNAYLIPVTTRDGESSVQISQQHFNDLSDAMGHIFEDGVEQTPVYIMHSDVLSTLRVALGEEAFKIEPPKNTGQYNFGELGLTYMHPAIGKVTLLGDPIAPVDRIRFLIPQDWLRVYYGFRGFQFMEDQGGMWFRKAGGLANGGRSKFFRAEGYELAALHCRRTRVQGEIRNISA